jgi:hypothetical protein
LLAALVALPAAAALVGSGAGLAAVVFEAVAAFVVVDVLAMGELPAAAGTVSFGMLARSIGMSAGAAGAGAPACRSRQAYRQCTVSDKEQQQHDSAQGHDSHAEKQAIYERGQSLPLPSSINLCSSSAGVRATITVHDAGMLLTS